MNIILMSSLWISHDIFCAFQHFAIKYYYMPRFSESRYRVTLVLMIIFTLRVTFLDNLILMGFFLFWIYVNALNDLMVNAKMEI